MKRSERGSWWGLYALVPITAGLLYVVATMKLGKVLHLIVLLALVAVLAVLMLLWSERHADLMGSEGVDAQAERSSLAAAGIEAGGLAPSLTARQAHYRHVMLARATDKQYDER